MRTKKTAIIIIACTLILLALGFGGHYIFSQMKQKDAMIKKQSELINTQQAQLEKTKKETDELKQQVKKLSRDAEKMKGDIETTKEENKALKRKNERLENDNSSLTKEVHSLKISKATPASAGVSRLSSSSSVKGTFRMKATAYTAYCNGCSGTTATGINLRANPNIKMIAVDPSIIPLGSKVWVEGYGYAVAGDKGGGIRGHEIDIFMPSTKAAYNWGNRTVTVKVLN